MTNPITLHWDHGLGDTANFAHMLPLWTRRGFKIQVACSPDKAAMFKAAGVDVTEAGGKHHAWLHPPAPGEPQMTDDWSGNKSAWNLVHSGVLPRIGDYPDLWPEFASTHLTLDPFVSEEVRAEVDRYVSQLPRPVICLHTKGNTSPGAKNYPDPLTVDLYRELIDRTGGTLLLLDWDRRIPWFHHHAVRYVAEDFRTPDLVTLFQLVQRSDLLLGIDSGVLHFGRFTRTPSLGIWHRHHPAHFAVPRPNTVHICPDSAWTRRRRLAFNLVDVPNDVPSASAVATVAARMVRPGVYLDQPGPDAVVQHLIDRCRQTAPPHHQFRDRHRSMGEFMKLIKRTPNPTVVETGCIRAEEDYSAGFSSFIFGAFLKHHGGRLDSVDLDGGNVDFARRWTVGLPVTVHESDSRPFLSSWSGGPIDGLYLDSADTDTPSYQEICLAEAEAALPHLTASCPILIDDTPYSGGGKWYGKGALAIPMLLSKGWVVSPASGYQTLLVRDGGNDVG